MKLRCLIIDDEPLSLDVLEKYIEDAPDVQLEGRCNNAMEAIEMLKNVEVDLIFLDINMPKLSGIDFVKAMDDLPEIIFTTAYPEYAVESYDLEVLDYLVKPISFDRFLRSVNKASRKILGDNGSQQTSSFLMIKTDKKLFKIQHSDILFFESIGDFIKIHTREKVHISNETLKNIEKQMSPKEFVRIHKSYIISLKALKYLEGNQAVVDKHKLPVGGTYKENLMKLLS